MKLLITISVWFSLGVAVGMLLWCAVGAVKYKRTERVTCKVTGADCVFAGSGGKGSAVVLGKRLEGHSISDEIAAVCELGSPCKSIKVLLADKAE